MLQLLYKKANDVIKMSQKGNIKLPLVQHVLNMFIFVLTKGFSCQFCVASALIGQIASLGLEQMLMLKFLYQNLSQQVDRYKQFIIFFDKWTELDRDVIDIFQVTTSFLQH